MARHRPAHTSPTRFRTFADVTAGHHADQAIGWAHQQNITTGCGTNTDDRRLFCPDQPVTRSQTATLLHRITTTPTSWGPNSGILQPNRTP